MYDEIDSDEVITQRWMIIVNNTHFSRYLVLVGYAADVMRLLLAVCHQKSMITPVCNCWMRR